MKNLVPRFLREIIRTLRVRSSFKHIDGKKSIQLNINECAVTCIAKNVEYYLPQFIDHYLELGFKHIFVLDNGSKDKTRRIAKDHPKVSLYSTNLPIVSYQAYFQREFTRKVVKSGWCIHVDCDEFFDFPGSSENSLSQLLEYCNKEGYNALVAQQLDVFSSLPIKHMVSRKNEDLKDTYNHFDLSSVKHVAYKDDPLGREFGDKNKIPDGLDLCYGGIRKALYNLDCLLTKHPLFRVDADLDRYPHIHFINSANLANIVGVLVHYKMTSNAIETAYQNQKAFNATSQGYANFIKMIKQNQDEKISPVTAIEYKGPDQLVKHKFILGTEHSNYIV